jgi:hypothetical protein
MSTISALNTFKQLGSVRLVASGNQSGTYYNGPTNNGVGATFTYATGSLTIDSVVVAVNEFVLLAGQTAGYQNGIYQCTTAGATGVAAVLTRRGDFQCIEQIKGGQYVPVVAGTAFGGSMWVVIEPLPAAIGVPGTSGANNINFATITAAGSSLYLQVANNLSDLNSASAAVTNLGFGQAATKYMYSSLTTPDQGANLISFDVTVGQAALAAGGSVSLQASSGAKQYKIRSLQLNSGGTNFSGGGGDRLGSVTDGTTVYSVIPAATMQTLANAQWGATALPNPASAAINTSTAAGAALVFKYSGGTTDYTAGSLVISGIVQRVA